MSSNSTTTSNPTFGSRMFRVFQKPATNLLRHPKMQAWLSAMIHIITPVSSKSVQSGNSVQSSGGFELTKDHDTGIALLCIKNWEKKNCFTGSMMAKFTELLEELEQWNEVCKVVQEFIYLIFLKIFKGKSTCAIR